MDFMQSLWPSSKQKFASIYCNNPQLFTDDRQNQKNSLSYFIPNYMRTIFMLLLVSLVLKNIHGMNVALKIARLHGKIPMHQIF